MTESACLSMAPLRKLLSKTLGQLKVISATPDIVAVDENGIDSTFFIERVTLAPTTLKEMMEPTKTATRRKNVIAEMQTKRTEKRMHNWEVYKAKHRETSQNLQKGAIHCSTIWQ